jgi:hypothetical protein
MMLHGSLKSLIACQFYVEHIWFVNSYIAESALSVDYTWLGHQIYFCIVGPEISGTGLQVVNLLEKPILCT